MDSNIIQIMIGNILFTSIQSLYKYFDLNLGAVRYNDKYFTTNNRNYYNKFMKLKKNLNENNCQKVMKVNLHVNIHTYIQMIRKKLQFLLLFVQMDVICM